jgi:hypothetical protein|tara:strand:- start:859 stop:1119 length:261 start_codon:yes stop_codon:yes gene_type:complete
MTAEKVILIVGVLTASLWLIPAAVLTLKVRHMDDLEPALKKQLIIPMWTIPLIGNLVCYFMFANTGKLTPMSAKERLGIWLGGFMP